MQEDESITAIAKRVSRYINTWHDVYDRNKSEERKSSCMIELHTHKCARLYAFCCISNDKNTFESSVPHLMRNYGAVSDVIALTYCLIERNGIQHDSFVNRRYERIHL